MVIYAVRHRPALQYGHYHLQAFGLGLGLIRSVDTLRSRITCESVFLKGLTESHSKKEKLEGFMEVVVSSLKVFQ